MKKFIALSLALMLTGCSLIPKRVELFQDKVKPVPVLRESEIETQRQAAKAATVYTQAALVAAVAEGSSTNVTKPAGDAAVITSAISTSLGPPSKPSTLPATDLARKLDSTGAALSGRLADFKADNDENAGKKIEGTGLFQIPYFVWLGGAALLGFVCLIAVSIGWSILKVYALSNPPLQMGMNVASMGAKTVSKGFTQLVKGGENFKERVSAEIADKEIAEKVLAMFKSEQQKSQNEDVQEVVKHLTSN